MLRLSVFSLFFISLLHAAGPVLSYSAVWGAGQGPPISAVAVDAKGNLYIAGATSQAIPLVNPLQPKLGTGNCSPYPQVFTPCPDIFLAKLDPTGTKILYSTYLGDNGYDVFGGLAVDAQGNAYIAATSFAPTAFPPPPSAMAGAGFVRKVSPDGTALVYTQSLGTNTLPAAIALDAAGNALVTGASNGTAFPAVNAIQAHSLVKSMFVTADGGATWSAVQTGALKVNALAIPQGQSSTLYAATSSGLLKSTDGGATWANLIPAAVSATQVALDPKNPSIVYAVYTPTPVNGASPAAMTLARSADAGATWSVISGTLPLNPYTAPGSPAISALAIDPENTATIWIGTSDPLNNTIFMTTNGGVSWQPVLGATPMPPSFPFSFTAILIDPTNSAHAYACCAKTLGGGLGAALEITQDEGQTWVRGGSPPGAGVLGFLTVTIDPANPSILYAALASGLVRSTDGGQSWSALNLPRYPGSWNSVLIDPATETIYALNDAGYLVTSTDGGNTWSTKSGPWVANSTLLAVDPARPGTVYVSSPNPGVQDAFVTKIGPAGSIVWATLLGGSAADQGLAIAVDRQGNAYITGLTRSYDFPLANPLEPVFNNGKGNQTDAFVAEISADGSKLVYSTYLGGSGPDFGTTIGVDGSGNAWVAGSTVSPDFPLVNPEQAVPPIAYGSAFLAKVSTGGQKLLYSTYLSGAFAEPGILLSIPEPSLTVDGNGDAWVAGISNSVGLPLVNPIQASIGSGFWAEFAPNSSLLFSTYLDLGASSVAITGSGSAWLAGGAFGPNFQSVGSTLVPAPSALATGFIARIDPPVPVPGTPRINAIYNAASWEVGDVVAPGEIVSIIGAGLAPSAASATGAPLPPSLNGVTVTIGGVPAPLFYVSPGQINLQAPFSVTLGTADLVIAGNAQSLTRPVRVVALRAGIFAVTHAADFSLVTPQNPAVPGEYLAIFATGLGPTHPSIPAGEASPLAPSPLAASATVVPDAGPVGGGPTSPASYAGLAPGTVGIYQVNYQLTTSIDSGVSGLYIAIGSHGDQTNMVPLYVK